MAITPLISDPDGTSWPGLSRPSTAWLGRRFESWMPGSSPGMTGSGASVIRSQCAKQWKYDMVISRDCAAPKCTLIEGILTMPYHPTPVLLLYLTGGQ